mmetsp:Transcript_27736/g.77553  ORF Transcript_27736/g.77553 Transcript_27736/m.77553 type:complete len:255 (+) Transcript_27736:56-820(+)
MSAGQRWIPWPNVYKLRRERLLSPGERDSAGLLGQAEIAAALHATTSTLYVLTPSGVGTWRPRVLKLRFAAMIRATASPDASSSASPELQPVEPVGFGSSLSDSFASSPTVPHPKTMRLPIVPSNSSPTVARRLSFPIPGNADAITIAARSLRHSSSSGSLYELHSSSNSGRTSKRSSMARSISSDPHNNARIPSQRAIDVARTINMARTILPSTSSDILGNIVACTSAITESAITSATAAPPARFRPSSWSKM